MGDVTPCAGTCASQCDDCHDLTNCVGAVVIYGELTLCAECRKKYPAQQPWHIDPETGEHVAHPGFCERCGAESEFDICMSCIITEEMVHESCY